MPAPFHLDALLHPRSIALIGASRDPDSMSGTLLRNLRESFRGPIFAINPQADQVGGLTAYRSISDVPGPIDLALIAVPSAFVLDVARQSVGKGVKALVVITAGFDEMGDEGHRRADELRQLADSARIPLLGPNCFGLLNTDPASHFNATFSTVQLQPGNVGVLTQSGALGFVFPEFNRKRNVGVSMLASLGNKLCLGENDLLQALEHDERTSVVQLYLESFQAPRLLREYATRVSRSKPILALKAGRTTAGQRAAGSHTAALASPAAAAEALFHQSGIIAANSLEELFDITALLATQPLPRGRRVAILTNAGGPGVLCADAAESAGLQLPEFSAALQQGLREFLPAEATVRNPIDLIGSTDPDQFAHCLKLLIQHDAVDSMVVIYVPRLAQTSDAIAARIVDVLKQFPTHHTMLSVFMQQEAAPQVLTSADPPLPAWTFPESAVRALAAAVRLEEWRRRPPEPDITPPASFDVERLQQIISNASSGWLPADTTAAILAAAGIAAVEQVVVETVDDAVDAARRIGFPVVVKAVAPGLVHRSESGAVVVDVRDSKSLRRVSTGFYESIPGCHSLLIQKFVDCRREVIIGVNREATFGHLIGFGRGGVDVEVLDDVKFRMHPLTKTDAEDLLRDHPVARLLEAHRGCPPADVPALIDALLRISELLTVCPAISEVDLNPIKVLDRGNGICVVDARIRI